MIPADAPPGNPRGGIGGSSGVPGPYASAIARRLAAWTAEGTAARVWRRDPTVWPGAVPESVRSRLGGLDAPVRARAEIARYEALRDALRKDGVETVVLLGMGGSSLAAQVYGAAFDRPGDAPELRVLDSTHPDRVRAVREGIDLGRTVFLVSSKSGTTLEPNAMLAYFWSEVVATGAPPGPRFVAITDPGSALERLARTRGFREVVPGPPDVGGRYSALTAFGLLPAALLGIDLDRLLARAERMVIACGPERAPVDHPGLQLGAFLGELGRAGRNKVVFWAPPPLTTFPDWLEQLLAESTGKHGTGLVPIAGERRPLDPPRGRDDRVWVELGLDGRPAAFSAGAATPPYLRLALEDPYDLGAEFFRWEFGVALAGAVLGIDPFDQPDVEEAKELARQRMGGSAAPDRSGVSTVPVAEAAPAVGRWASTVREGDYLAIQAYLDPSPSIATGLEEARTALRERLRIPTTLGFGPRYLHSTGQLHKGGPSTALFLQLVDVPRVDLPVPGEPYSFGAIVRAQAEGDAEALRARSRRLLTVQLGPDPVAGLRRLVAEVGG